MKDLHKIKLTYIGGGSKQWARVFMNDLALAKDISGDIVLYDVDVESAIRNKKIGERINQTKEAVSKWNYILPIYFIPVNFSKFFTTYFKKEPSDKIKPPYY